MKNKQGFTLIEIMIVIAIIGIIMAVAIPSFSKAGKEAKKSSCINNLQILEGVVDTWALQEHIPNGTQIDPEKLRPYLKHNELPVCPAGGTYTYGKVGDDYTVHCSIQDHDDSYEHKGASAPATSGTPATKD